MTDHSEYSVEDFVADSSFRAWVLKTNEASCAWWDNWLKEHPGKQPLVEDAVRVVKQLQFRPAKPSLAEMDEVRKRIEESMTFTTIPVQPLFSGAGGSTGNNPGEPKSRLIKFYKITAVAASVMLVVGVYGLWQRSVKTTISTEYGSTRQITLPDGSSVMLNAHSSLSYKKDWTEEKGREVWIEGEAFFNVSPKPAGKIAGFVVHAKGMDIKVLGTSFNVYGRRDKVDVVLETGKVLAKATGKGEHAGERTMRPGQMINLETPSSPFQVTEVDPQQYTSWRQQRLVFSNRPISDVARVLEDNYGYAVIWKNEKTKNLTFTGSCPTTNIQLLLSALRAVHEIKITQEGNTIIID